MLKQVNISTARMLPKRYNEVILKNDKFIDWHSTKATNPYIFKSVNNCEDVSGAIYAGQNFFLGFRVNPNILNSGNSYLTKKFAEMFKKAFEMGEEVKGFVCGGLSEKINVKDAVSSYVLYNRVAEIFDNNEIPFGMICGKNKSATADNISIYKTKILMCGDYLHDFFAQERKTPMTLGNIPDIYDDVMTPNDTNYNLVLDKNI